MAQLFRDQCRDAWAAGRTWGVAVLWLHTLPDLVKTSFFERCSNFNPGKFMTDTLNALRPRKFPTFVFFAVFIVVFLITLAIATAVTFILPETWASIARIKVEPDPSAATSTSLVPDGGNQVYDPYFLQTTFEIMQSQMVLSNVISSLDLNEAWGRKYYGGEVLKTAETMEILKRRLELKTIRNTKLITITVYSDDRNEAAQIANAVGAAYRDYRLHAWSAAMSNSLASLEKPYQQQEPQIALLDREKDRLAKNFGVVGELPAEISKQYNSQIIDGQRTCEALRTRLQELQALVPSQLQNVLPTITADSALSGLLDKLHDAQQQMATLKDDYGPADMHIVRVTSELNELNSEIKARVAGIMTALQSEVDSQRAAVAALSASFNTAMENSKPTAENQSYWDKKSQLDQLLSFHNTLAAKIDEEKLSQLSPPILVEFTDFAQPGDAPVKPNKTLNIFIGAMAGVFLGAVAGTIAAFMAGRIGRRKAAGTV
jgi:uncharacterized protein involved in exopolysaccharide biosynthesis